MPGPPYLFGVFAVILAMLIAFFIPKSLNHVYRPLTSKEQGKSENNQVQKKLMGKLSDSEDQQPLLDEDKSIL